MSIKTIRLLVTFIADSEHQFWSKKPRETGELTRGVLASAGDVGFQGDHKFHAF